MLAAGLLMGGGAVAAADPDSDSSSSAADGDDGTTASAEASTTASSPVGNVTDTSPETNQGVTSTFGSGREPGEQPSTSAESANIEPGGTNTDDEPNDSGVVAADPEAVSPAPEAVAPVPDVVAPVPEAVAPASDVVAPVPDVVATVPEAVAPPVPSVALVPDPVAPAPDVIALVEDVLGSVAGVLPPLQADVFSWFGFAGDPAVHGVGGAGGAGLPAAAGSLRGVRNCGWSCHLPLSPGARSSANAKTANAKTAVASPGGISASAFGGTTEVDRVSSPEMAAPAATGSSPMGVRSFARHVFTELLQSPSLLALAALALPGAGGLVILTACGVRVGYRQAKAGFALPAAGIVRFVRPEPLPVVCSEPLGVRCSGPSVIVRPRRLRVVRPAPLSAGCLLDKAA